MEQKVFLKLKDEKGNLMGNLTISGLSKVEQTSQPSKDGIMMENVPLVEKPDNETPIQYCSFPNKKNFSPLMLLEETEYQILFESDDSSSEFEVLPDLMKKDFSHKPFKPFRFSMGDSNHYRCAGTLNFRSYVGKSFITVIKDDISSIPIPIEVRSKKIKYYEQYPAMIADLSEYASGLIFELKSPLYQNFYVNSEKRSTLYEDFMFLEYLFRPENLPAAYEYITRNMYSRLESYVETVPSSFTSNLGPREMIKVISTPENLHKSKNTPKHWPKNFNKYMPNEVDQIRHHDSIDIPENRFFKYFLESLDYLIAKLLNDCKEGYIKDKLFDFSEELGYYLSQRWLKEVGRMQFAPLNSQVLQKKEGYRDILKYFLMLELSFRLNWEEISENFKGYERRLSELYEYWCYFKLLKVLNRLSFTKLDFEDVYEINKDKWSINVRKGENSAHNFNLIINDKVVKIKLMYNRLFSQNTKNKSYSLAFRPDYSLLIEINSRPFFIHFDAKYRSEVEILTFYEKIKSANLAHEKADINKKEEEEAIKRDSEEEKSYKYKNGDIYKMHTYKDAILRTEGAYVLYPGTKKDSIFKVDDANYIPSVGAFPLNPGQDGKEEDNLAEFIKGVISNLI